MSDFGFMAVDWEERINFERMRKERLNKAKAALKESDLDGLMIFRYEDVRYLTSFRSHLGPTVLFGLASVYLPRDGEPLLFTMDMDHARARMPWMATDQIQPRPNVREAIGIRRWIERIQAVLGHDVSGAIGVDLWTPSMADALGSALPNATFVDGYSVLLNAKMTKTVDEIQCLRAATSMTEAAMHAALRVLRPGIRECEVLATAWHTMTALGSEWTQCANIVASGPYTAPYRRFTSDRVIQLGDPVIIDIGACYNGYWGDFTRTYICGDIRPTAEQIALHQECYDSLWRACEAARAGNTNADVFAAAEPVELFSLGHSSGTSPWEPPYLSADAKDAPIELEPGMVLNIEPYRGRPEDGGFRLENNVSITTGAPDVYTPFPFDYRLLRDVHPLDRTTGRTGVQGVALGADGDRGAVGFVRR